MLPCCRNHPRGHKLRTRASVFRPLGLDRHTLAINGDNPVRPCDAQCRNHVTRIHRGQDALEEVVVEWRGSRHIPILPPALRRDDRSTGSALTKGKREVPRLEAPRANCFHHYDRATSMVSRDAGALRVLLSRPGTMCGAHTWE